MYCQDIMKHLFCFVLLSVTALQGCSSQETELVSLSPIQYARTGKHEAIQSRFEQEVEVNELYYSSDGLRIHGFLAKPKQEGKFPVIFFNRGGNRDFGELDSTRALYLLGTMASWGYIAVATNYRGSTKSEGNDEFGGEDVNDILNLMDVVDALPYADTSRMGIYGHSRGGMMTYRTLTHTCRFKAAVAGGAVTDLALNARNRPEMRDSVFAELIPGYGAGSEEALRTRSAVHWPEKLCKSTPLLILHGTADWRVSVRQALDMANTLYQIGFPFRMKLFEGGDHGMSEYRAEVWTEIRAFFDSYVRDGKALPDMSPHGK